MLSAAAAGFCFAARGSLAGRVIGLGLCSTLGGKVVSNALDCGRVGVSVTILIAAKGLGAERGSLLARMPVLDSSVLMAINGVDIGGKEASSDITALFLVVFSI